MTTNSHYAARIALHLTDDTGAERQLGIGPFTLRAATVEAARDAILTAVRDAKGVEYTQPSVEVPRRRSRAPEPPQAPTDAEAPPSIGGALELGEEQEPAPHVDEADDVTHTER